MVWDGCGVDVYVVGVMVGVLVKVDVPVRVGVAMVGGTSIPVSKRPVVLIPMKNPMDRYLMSARIVTGIFNFCGSIEGMGSEEKG
jgi:hypothetical protein